jgi:hypothetical protein
MIIAWRFWQLILLCRMSGSYGTGKGKKRLPGFLQGIECDRVSGAGIPLLEKPDQQPQPQSCNDDQEADRGGDVSGKGERYMVPGPVIHGNAGSPENNGNTCHHNNDLDQGHQERMEFFFQGIDTRRR